MARTNEQRWPHGERVRHRILAEIQRYMSATGSPPTYAEIATRVGLSPESIKRHLKILEKQGFVMRPPSGNRGGAGLRLTEYE